MEKYYDLIVSMIKAHRKFSEYESILDEIAADVCEHAKVVLSTVSNEEVINSYLNKLVSTAMVTVPKRMGLVPERKTQVPLEVVLPEPEPAIEEIEMPDEQEELSTTEEAVLDEDVSEELEEASVEEVPVTVDKNLVDKMINGVSEHPYESKPERLEQPDEDELEALDDMELVDELDEIQEESLETCESDEVEEPVDEQSEADVLEEVEEANDEFEMLTDSEDGLLESGEDGILESEEAFQEDLGADLELNAEDELPAEEISDGGERAEEIDFEIPTFKCFSYKPQKEMDIDKNELVEELKTMDSNNPDLHIIQICRLKFEDKKSLQEISDALGCSQDTVQEALDIIVNTVKD